MKPFLLIILNFLFLLLVLPATTVEDSRPPLTEIQERNLESSAYFTWLHFIPKEALKANYEVLVEPAELIFKYQEEEKEITIEVISKRDFSQFFCSMSCAWYANFSTHNEEVDIVRWPCRGNVNTLERLEPSGTWSKRIKVKKKLNSRKGSFRIYFYPFDRSVSWQWSNNAKREIDYFFASNLVHYKLGEPVDGVDAVR